MNFRLIVLFLGCLFISKSNSQEVDFSFNNNKLSIEERVDILVSQMTVDEMISQLVNQAAALPRFEIPDYNWWNEALHGVARNGKATIFPQGIALGATFDPDLIKRVASAISTEARAKYAVSQSMGNHSKFAGLTFWTPNINIFRDPRWGRGQETYGEDPFLTSKIGIAFVEGLQGDDPNYLKTAACAKHFAVHSGPETLRHKFNAVPSKQDLHETYLPAFEALVTEGKVEGVMAAYNAVYGEPSAASPFLLKETLRKKWNFDGYVTSDCGAIYGIANKLNYVKTPVEAAAAALLAGTNLNCGQAYKNLKKSLEKGLVTKELLAKRTKQLFKTRFRLGIVGGDDNNPYLDIGADKIHCDEHVKLAREAAQKSIVLLKNSNNTLPISKDVKIPYVTGPFANSGDMLIGSYYGVSPNLVTILEGIADAVSLGTSLNYRSGALPFQKNLNPKNWAPRVAAESDVTICVVGLTADWEGEEVDAIASADEGDKRNLKLPQNQIDYINEMIKYKKGPLVLVVASGSPVSLEEVEAGCDAILQIWYPGEQGGHAVADVLFGKVSPTGHLPITFPKNIAQLPPYENYSMQGRTYKYMTKEPRYPFGFGLTYSKTEIRNLELKHTKIKNGEYLDVEVEVANSGDYDIDEVVQLYMCPTDTSGGIPLKSLKGFKRISLKKRTHSKVSFRVAPELLKVVNAAGEKVWRKGKYKVIVGNCSPTVKAEDLGAAIQQEAIITLK